MNSIIHHHHQPHALPLIERVQKSSQASQIARVVTARIPRWPVSLGRGRASHVCLRHRVVSASHAGLRSRNRERPAQARAHPKVVGERGRQRGRRLVHEGAARRRGHRPRMLQTKRSERFAEHQVEDGTDRVEGARLDEPLAHPNRVVRVVALGLNHAVKPNFFQVLRVHSSQHLPLDGIPFLVRGFRRHPLLLRARLIGSP
mmetsp:Transcript_3466/g.8945  ORF Transcript_3466/g.8945 Transcript_3466/m.8945 type:complete len:202 (-) Transcript_3466:5448-6053(-)